MSDLIFIFLTKIDELLWDFIDLLIILLVGIYFTITSKFFQFRALLKLKPYIKELIQCSQKASQGVNPLKLYFASIGGMIGLGNIVTVASAITFGGPGSIIWLWIASFLGMLVKYSEVYLGIKYRKSNDNKGFDGGPMYYLKSAFKNRGVPVVVSILLCIYGAEVSQFLILTDSIVKTFTLNRYLIIFILLLSVTFTSVKGIKRFATISSIMLPPFMLCYIIIGLWIILDNLLILPKVFSLVFLSFLNYEDCIGGIVSGGTLLSAHYGVSRAVYSGDIGIGYDSIIQSETQSLQPEKQARMSIFSLFTDSLVCTISILLLLVTGIWEVKGLQSSEYVVGALRLYLPSIEYFTTILFIFAGFTTISGYLVVGQKSAKYLNKRFGSIIYMFYSILVFIFFSFYGQEQVIMIMSVSGGLLMLINIIGVFKLRKKIKFL